MRVNWKQTAFVVIDIVIAAYLVLAITAFNKPDETGRVCNEVNIEIAKGENEGFLNADEIKKYLQKRKLYPLGQPMQQIDARKIEDALNQSLFVEEAQCYKTHSGHICITLKQKQPVVRVQADNGDDYYIDSHGSMLQNTYYPSDLIIATGNINKKYAQKVLTPIANTIVSDKFWNNQIEQINVLADGSIEIVPRVGDHIVYLGQPKGIETKLARLQKFYRYGLSEAGWNKYSYISLEFDNQIICKKKHK